MSALVSCSEMSLCLCRCNLGNLNAKTMNISGMVSVRCSSPLSRILASASWKCGNSAPRLCRLYAKVAQPPRYHQANQLVVLQDNLNTHQPSRFFLYALAACRGIRFVPTLRDGVHPQESQLAQHGGDRILGLGTPVSPSETRRPGSPGTRSLGPGGRA